MLKERQKSILDAVVRSYIRTARPVSSDEIIREFQFGVSPATMRSEMAKLDEMGYVAQPHTSAGRVPTDKGYRFFVDHLVLDATLSGSEEDLINGVFRIAAEDEFVKELSKIMSRLSGIFAAVGAFGDDIFYETGFSEVLDEPEFQEAGYVKTFGRVVDALDEKVENLMERCDARGGSIFIGSENPLKEARDYSMMISSWEHPRGFSGFFTMVGPKRTNYQKHKAILHSMGARKTHG